MIASGSHIWWNLAAALLIKLQLGASFWEHTDLPDFAVKYQTCILFEMREFAEQPGTNGKIFLY